VLRTCSHGVRAASGLFLNACDCSTVSSTITSSLDGCGSDRIACSVTCTSSALTTTNLKGRRYPFTFFRCIFC
jgi:hypothetical protein